MSSYGNDSKPAPKKRGRPKKVKDPAPTAQPELNAPAAAPAPVKKQTSGKMTEKQKADLKKHMEGHKKKGMSASEMKSHRMKMMSRMRRGMSIAAAHKDIMK